MSNISNLLRYDISAIKYQYHLKDATLSAGQNFATQDTHFSDAQLSLQTEQPQIRQDSTDFFASIGLKTIGNLIDSAAEDGYQAALEATGNYGEIADQMAEIDKGVTPAQVYRQKALSQSRTSLVVKSAAPIHISFAPGEVHTQYTPAEVEIDWDVERAMRRYTPAEFNFQVLQPPSIAFTYLGDFQYIPESAAPGFDRLV